MLDIIVMACLVASGALCGWWLRGGLIGMPAAGAPSTAVDSTLAELRTIAVGVAEDLDEHHNQMEQFRRQLQAAARKGPEEILIVVSRLIETNEEMQRQLQSAEDQLQHQAEELASHAEEARTDALTGLANRRAFEFVLGDSARAFRQRQEPTALLMMDVDHFKRFNDQFGHQAGDEVLRGVAQILQAELGGLGIACRYGGEEFAVIFTGRTCKEVGEAVEHCRTAIAGTAFEFEGAKFRITCSAGLAEFIGDEEGESLVARADDALYRSKERGRNQGHWHDGRRVRPLADAWKPAFTAHVATEQKVVNLERTDFSAGVSTQAVFLADVERRLEERRRGAGTQLSLLFARIDDFEEHVERYGESAARAVMRAATLLVKANMRDMDHVAEFDQGTLSLLLPGADLESAVRIAERLRQAAGRCRLPAQRFPPERFTFTLAVAQADPDEKSGQLVERVEQTIQEGAGQSRNCTYKFEDGKPQLVGAGGVSLV